MRLSAEQPEDESPVAGAPGAVERRPGVTALRTRPSVSFVLFMLAIIVAGAGGLTWAFVRPDPRTVEITIPTPGPLVVHVTGDVENPGVYTLQPGSRVADAVDAAGGLVVAPIEVVSR